MFATSQMNAEPPVLGWPGMSDASISRAIRQMVNTTRDVIEMLLIE